MGLLHNHEMQRLRVQDPALFSPQPVSANRVARSRSLLAAVAPSGHVGVNARPCAPNFSLNPDRSPAALRAVRSRPVSSVR
jgi:hypothetical protein